MGKMGEESPRPIGVDLRGNDFRTDENDIQRGCAGTRQERDDGTRIPYHSPHRNSGPHLRRRQGDAAPRRHMRNDDRGATVDLRQVVAGIGVSVGEGEEEVDKQLGGKRIDRLPFAVKLLPLRPQFPSL